jgi:5-methylcytosine-specific restriction endonuclease McrA
VPRRETRTYQDRKEYLIKAVSKRRKVIREKAVTYLGGKCSRCGYNRCLEALEFHHLDPNQKDFSISERGHSRSWERVQKELDKCVILCANCHREVTCRIAASVGNCG